MNHPPHDQRPRPQGDPKQRRTQYYTHGKYAEESAVGDLVEQDGTGTAATSTNSSTSATEATAAATQEIGAAAAASAVDSTADIVGTANATTIEPMGTSNVTSDDNTTVPSAPHQDTTRRPYPLQPSTLKAATSYTLFSDPQAFHLSAIYNRTHYLSTSLRGKLWWDINGDGKRGEYGNATLNEMEYDYGVSNVGNIVLVSCSDDDDDGDDDGDDDDDASGGTGPQKMASAASAPFNGRDATPLRQSIIAQAGIYNFMQMNTVPSGRYYVMYEAPRGWRLTGNVLPLERRETDSQMGLYECIPRGGNGGELSELARDVGDFDHHGYCARSIGCVEIGSRSELEDKFEKLQLLDDTDYYKNVIQGDTEVDLYGMNGMAYTGGKMVALPTPYALDVGLMQEEWALHVKQYVDATVTLTFPVAKEDETMLTPMESELGSVFVNADSFGTSMHRKAVSGLVEKYLKENMVNLSSGGDIHEKDSEDAIFELSGVDFFDAKIERKTKDKKDAIESNGRYLRASRNAQEDEEVIEITYSFTARGSYNPPPHDQLGYFVQNSINADPDNFVRTLREDITLPFQDLESADSTHLTVGPPAPRTCNGCVGIQAQAVSTEDSGGMANWATIPVSLFSLMIGALICLFLSRRIWKRRRDVEPDKDRKMATEDFAISDIEIKNEKILISEKDGSKPRMEKKKKKKKKKHSKRESLEDHSDNSSVSDTSEGSNPNSLQAKEEDSSSSSSSEDSSSSSSSEDSEAQCRRRRKERKAKRESRRHSGNHDDPPTHEDLRREKKKKKKRTSRTTYHKGS